MKLDNLNRIEIASYTDEYNIGDVIAPHLFEHIFQINSKQVNCLTKINNVNILGIGSILAFCQPSSIVFGSGFLNSQEKLLFKPLHISGVRGGLSKDIIFNQTGLKPEIISDPGLLLKLLSQGGNFYSKSRSCYIPHYIDEAKESLLIAQNLSSDLLLPTLPVNLFIKKLSHYNKVYSRSLHGIIFADALSLPRVWIEPSHKILDSHFKFLDYFSSIQCDSPFLPITEIYKKVDIKDYEFKIDNTVLNNLIDIQIVKFTKIIRYYRLFKLLKPFTNHKKSLVSNFIHPGWEGCMDEYK